MTTRLYVMAISNPAAAGAAMVRHKRIPHRVVNLMPGLHPILVRFAGFAGHTVPALEAEGRKVQGSRQIARFLDELKPDPPLFPADPEDRRRVEEAELWGEVMRLPLPPAMQVLFAPVIRQLARVSHADEQTVQADLELLPALLDRADALIAEGTIGGGEPNAADFQILASVRVLLEFEDLSRMLAGRACVPAARRLYPDWVGPIPSGLPIS